MVKRISTSRPIANLPREIKGGFTLVELLAVLAIAAILAVLTTPAIQSLLKAGTFTKSVYAMADSLNLARTYAMANNTYVYVGLTEVDNTKPIQTNPQVAGTGRVALAIVATKDGTNDSTLLTTNYGTGTFLTQVRQVQAFDFVHIVYTANAPLTTTVGTGNMVRPTNITTALLTQMKMPATAVPTTPFSIPLGSSLGSGKYNFYNNTSTQILCFNPQGGVLLSGAAVLWLEIDLQPMRGTVKPTTANEPNRAALLIDGVTGSITVYRP